MVHVSRKFLDRSEEVMERKVSFVCVLMLASFAQAQDSQPKEEMLHLINGVRNTPLEYNEVLAEAAQKYAEKLEKEGGFGHYHGSHPTQRMAWVGYRWNNWCENMACVGYDPQSTFNIWWNSGGHRMNMLHSGMRQVGFGRSGIYWIAMFAAPAGETTIVQESTTTSADGTVTQQSTTIATGYGIRRPLLNIGSRFFRRFGR